MPRDIKALIEAHKSYYESYEKPLFDKSRALYRGKHFQTDGTNIESRFLCSENMVFSVAESAISSMLGPNPRVSAKPAAEGSEELAPAVTAFLNWCFRANKIRSRAAMAMVDAVLCNRGVIKVGWSKDKDRPTIRTIDPSMVFFDLSVRDPDDIRYWLEITVLSFDEYTARVTSGKYKGAGDVEPDVYPAWIVGPDADASDNKVREATKWVEVWEMYDVEEGKVQHYVPNGDRVVFEDDLAYVPYTLLTMNHNGIDCRGLSEVQLILPQQESINELLTFWNKVAHLTVPRVLYDAGIITEEDLGNAVNSAMGSFVPIHTKTDMPGALREAFFEAPVPEMPATILEFLSKQEQIASFVSALAEAARGQVTGARTATELALIDAQLRTRLSTRVGNLAESLEAVAGKCLWLASKFMAEERQLEVAGSNEWATLTAKDLASVDVYYEMLAYNPISTNPAVEAEVFLGMIELLKSSENFDQRAVDEYLAETNALPQRLLRPREEVEDEQALAEESLAQEAAAAQQGVPAAQMEQPLMPEQMPVEANAMKDTVPFGPEAAEQLPPPQPPLS